MTLPDWAEGNTLKIRVNDRLSTISPQPNHTNALPSLAPLTLISHLSTLPNTMNELTEPPRPQCCGHYSTPKIYPQLISKVLDSDSCHPTSQPYIILRTPNEPERHRAAPPFTSAACSKSLHVFSSIRPPTGTSLWYANILKKRLRDSSDEEGAPEQRTGTKERRRRMQWADADWWEARFQLTPWLLRPSSKCAQCIRWICKCQLCRLLPLVWLGYGFEFVSTQQYQKI